MKAKGLWTSLNGETPGAKVYAAMIRETTAEGGGSRFKKVEHGMVAV